MQNPSILLADEPISSLDPKNSKVVMDDIKKINKQDGIMVICNLHSLEIAKEYCDRLIGLSDGKIVFDGHPSSLTKELAEQFKQNAAANKHNNYPTNVDGESLYEEYVPRKLSLSNSSGIT